MRLRATVYAGPSQRPDDTRRPTVKQYDSATDEPMEEILRKIGLEFKNADEHPGLSVEQADAGSYAFTNDLLSLKGEGVTKVTIEVENLTPGGRILTDDDFERLADEAEVLQDDFDRLSLFTDPGRTTPYG